MATQKGLQDRAFFNEQAFDPTLLPDQNNDFVNENDIEQFAKALASPESPTDGPDSTSRSTHFITALNDWRPVYQRVRRNGTRKRKKRPPPRRGKDETREGFVYTLLKWPLLVVVLGWIVVLGAAYMLTRLYIFLYEHFITIRGERHKLRQKMRSAATYSQWVDAACEMDQYLGNDKWKESDDYAYYNSATIHNVREELRRLRISLENNELAKDEGARRSVVEELQTLIEAAVKDNFVGVENARLYSETFYGTKNLVQSFLDEIELSLQALERSKDIPDPEKAKMFEQLDRNYGRSALCLSGGATFAYYHFGVAKALLDADVLPEVITGTSGGALVASLLATRTNEELKKLIVPALASRINACEDPITTWMPRWWRTGARFDSIEWARRCSWFSHGSLTFLEAYQRTGRILNVTCIPSDPHSPTVLANYLTAPDCVIWSAVLASAAVPGILNPVVLMRKTRSGRLAPYSFGHKWKDGSLRTDVPLKALNTYFNVTYSIVSQVNPHINLFFFSSRGAVGRPVTHRRGRGWRGGFLGSAVEQYLKLDLTKWLKVLRHLELLPRYLGQDWSEVWLQRFSGTITIWPRSVLSDFFNILSDPDIPRLARMLFIGQQSAFPKLKFITNRMKIERCIEAGRRATGDIASDPRRNQLVQNLSEDDLTELLTQSRRINGKANANTSGTANDESNVASTSLAPPTLDEAPSPTLTQRVSGWLRSPSLKPVVSSPTSASAAAASTENPLRRSSGSVISELKRQSGVFFDDEDDEFNLSGGEGSANGSVTHGSEGENDEENG